MEIFSHAFLSRLIGAFQFGGPGHGVSFLFLKKLKGRDVSENQIKKKAR